MTDAINGLTLKPDVVLIDALQLPALQLRRQTIIKGDSLSMTIAAASIVAKVIRDKIMAGYDILYPQYGFASHKGYATKAHLSALEKHGVLPFYRHSYRPIRQLTEKTLFDF